jgi:ribosome recycling factor
MDKIINETKLHMEKALEVMHHELTKIRTGRASVSILDEVRAEYYGTLTPLNQLATLSVPDPRTIAIQPWDAAAVHPIEKAIQKSGLGLNPVNDGKIIRVPIPALNEDRRRDLTKVVNQHAEHAKVSVRNVRRDANEHLKKLQKDSAITEDDLRKGSDRVQKLTDEYIKKIEEAAQKKDKDIMEV